MAAKRDVIAIIGTTGVGKTQLAVDLARWVKAQGLTSPKEAEIINADSMQVYRGLNIITNKATKEERDEYPHHLMDILDPGEEYRVDHFRNDAMRTVEEITARDNIPILVGGTMYFIQHLLFPGRLVSVEKELGSNIAVRPVKSLEDLSQEQKNNVSQLSPDVRTLLFLFDTLPHMSSPSVFPPDFPTSSLPHTLQTPEAYTSAVYQLLQAVDPVMTQRWHWRDIRKVSRSLQIFIQSGQLHSEILNEQAQSVQDTQYRTLIFWPYARPEVLEPRLDARVEKMCQRGLLDELRQLRKIARENQHLDLTKGIYQAIGYKEFADFLANEEDTSQTLSLESPEFKEAVDTMQTGTRQYARRQIKWIRNQLFPVIQACKANGKEGDVYLYLLDATSVDVWSDSVSGPAEAVLQAFLSRSPMPDPASLNPIAGDLLHSKVAPSPSRTTRQKIPCEVCTIDPERPFLVEEGQQMEDHKGSRGHRRRIQKLAKAQHGYIRAKETRNEADS